MESCELEANGQNFTWMNRREDDNFVMERLDRAFASVEWINSYPQYALHNHLILDLTMGPSYLTLKYTNLLGRDPLDLRECGVLMMNVVM